MIFLLLHLFNKIVGMSHVNLEIKSLLCKDKSESMHLCAMAGQLGYYWL